MPIQLIYQGKTKRCLPKFKFPRSFSVTFTENHWSNTEKTMEFFEKIIFPYLEKVKEENGYPEEQYSLVIMDTFKGEDNDIMDTFKGEDNDIMDTFKGEDNDIMDTFKGEDNDIMGTFKGEDNDIMYTFKGEDNDIMDTFKGEDNDIMDTFKGEDHDIMDTFKGEDNDIMYTFKGEDNDIMDTCKGEDNDIMDTFKGQDNDIMDTFKGEDNDIMDTFKGEDNDIMDTFKGEDNDIMRELCSKSKCEVVIVPHNLTNKFQPLDLRVNRAAKAFIQNCYNEWFANQVAIQLKRGIDPTDVKISSKLSDLKPLHAAWIVDNHL